MEERHDREQYFFDAATVARLADRLESFESPCCLCAPRVAEELHRRGRAVTCLDLDERFGHLPGYRRYDLTRPDWLAERFGVILCDPPFFNVSLTVLRHAIRQLAHHDTSQPLFLGYLQRRAAAVERTFAEFGLRATAERFGYETVVEGAKNDIVLFANRG